MAWTQTDLDVIEKAIASGQRRVRLDGREVEYHSISEMLKARDLIKSGVRAIENATAGIRRPTVYRTRTAKGL